MDLKANNAEAVISVALSNLTHLSMDILKQYDIQLRAISEKVQALETERDNLRVENDSLHAQLNQVEPNPLEEK